MEISMRPNRWICLVIFSLAVLVQPNQSFTIVPKTFVTNAVEEGAVCLDGSPPVYHLDAGKGEGARNWLIYLQGGGWCINSTIYQSDQWNSVDSCTNRAFGDFGSSHNMKFFNFSAIFGNDEKETYFYNWNRVIVRYCDGGSFSGDADKPDPVSHLYYRGARIFKVVMKELMAKGMQDAQNAILMGGSAGGLSVMINCDNFRNLFSESVRVKCIADSGFFLHVKDAVEAKFLNTVYSSVVDSQQSGMTLPLECISKLSPFQCFFPQNLVQYIKTPLFLYQSAFDSFQIHTTLRNGSAINDVLNNHKTISPGILQELRDYRQELIDAMPSSQKNIRYLITSKYLHSQASSGLGYKLPIFPYDKTSETVEQKVVDWFFDRTANNIVDPVDKPV